MDRYQPEASTLRYELQFDPPYLDLTQTASDLLQALYAGLDTSSRPTLQDMSVDKGSAISEHRVRLSLFRGNAQLSIDAAGFVGYFRNVGQSDLEVVSNVLAACLKSMAVFVPTSIASAESLRVDLPLVLEGGEAVRDKVLARIAKGTIENKILESAPEGTRSTPIFKMYFDNERLGWSATAELAPNFTRNDGLYATLISVDRAASVFRMASKDSASSIDFITHVTDMQSEVGKLLGAIMKGADLEPIRESTK